MSQMYNQSLYDVKQENSPPPLRRSRFLAWLKMVAGGLEFLKNKFNAWRIKNAFLIEYTGQKASLEKLLNDVTPWAFGGIYITNVANTVADFDFFSSEYAVTPPFIYFASEGGPLAYDFFLSELTGSHDFAIWIPSDMLVEPNYTEDLIRFYVERYRLAGKRYIINYY